MDDDYGMEHDEGDDLTNWEEEQVFQDGVLERKDDADLEGVTCNDCGGRHYTEDCPTADGHYRCDECGSLFDWPSMASECCESDDDHDPHFGFCHDCGSELKQYGCQKCEDMAEERQMYREDEG